MAPWWNHTVFYQIYMPSFCDGNNDGIGDFAGIRAKLPYLKQLGVGCVWLTPFYPSPKVDQGYDVSDYYGIDPDYGTMADFRAFIRQAHALGIRVLADVVMNHTSTAHAWFQASRASRSDPKRNWYIWREGANGAPPNNWQSFFGEPAWEWDAATGMYYYHSFARQQADLNWAEPEVRRAMLDMLDFWIDEGVDGFRLDVINNLTVTGCLTDNPADETGAQIHRYDINQPGIRDALRQIAAHVKRRGDIFLVGEISSDRLEVIRPYADDDLLDTTFNFNLGSMPRFDFPVFAAQLQAMCAGYRGAHRPTIFFGSHDMPRFPGRFGFDAAQARCLFTLLLTFRAYPFLYFGDELGMQSYVCHTFADARDVQGVIAYRQARDAGKPEEECLRLLNAASRDHGRNTMYWDETLPNGGFSAATPWIPWQPQPGASAEAQRRDPDSLFHFTARLAALRSTLPVLIDGDCTVEVPADGVIVCRRTLAGDELTALINFAPAPCRLPFAADGCRLLCATGPAAWQAGGGTVCLQGKSAAVFLRSTAEVNLP